MHAARWVAESLTSSNNVYTGLEVRNNRVVRKVGAYRDEDSVFTHALFLKPLAQAADGNTSCLAYAGVLVSETGLDERPYLAHQGRHVLAASLNSDTQSEYSTTAAVRIHRVEVLTDQLAQRWENLGRWQVCREAIDDPQGGLSWDVMST